MHFQTGHRMKVRLQISIEGVSTWAKRWPILVQMLSSHSFGQGVGLLQKMSYRKVTWEAVSTFVI